MFRALRFRNFRWFLTGQICSATGSWMQQVALGWLIYQLTGSAFYLGLIGGLGLLPSFFLAPIAGVLADAFDRRRILHVMQAATLAHALVLAWLVWSGSVTVPWLVGLSLFMGLVQGFDWPTRQSMLVHLVDERESLPNAIALNSTTFNLARLVGPGIAGVILSTSGSLLCFILNAFACMAGYFCVTRLRLPAPPKTTPGGAIIEFRLWRDLHAGAEYSWREPVIRRGILLCALASGCVMPYVALLPLFSAEVFSSEAGLYGLLSATPAVGAVLGGLLLAARRDQRDLTGRIFAVGLISSAGLLVFALSRLLPLSLAALVVLGGAQLLWIAGINTQLQAAVVDEKRGRVLSFYIMAFMGAVPVGYFTFGVLAESIGVAATCALGALTALLGNLWLHRGAFADADVVALSKEAV